jgi:hypothetical protein
MTPEIVNYSKSRGVRVMPSIGGITYTDAWKQALAENSVQFATNAAEVARQLGVGIEIDSRLTIDVAAGDRWLIALNRRATADWLRPDTPVLDYANAMVPARQPRSASDAIANWQEHIDGKPQYGPPVPPLAPAKLAVSLYIAEGSKVLPDASTSSTPCSTPRRPG